MYCTIPRTSVSSAHSGTGLVRVVRKMALEEKEVVVACCNAPHTSNAREIQWFGPLGHSPSGWRTRADVGYLHKAKKKQKLILQRRKFQEYQEFHNAKYCAQNRTTAWEVVESCAPTDVSHHADFVYICKVTYTAWCVSLAPRSLLWLS
jgi:hypothetical protein